MPVAVRDKLQAVTRDLGSQARVARLLGVSPSRVSRWLRAEQPDPENRRKLEGVEFVLGRLLELYERDAALDWLQGINAHLGDRRPMDLLAAGRTAEVLQAIQADEAGSFA
jgi:transcriptional regulator with XRE-family HTH domain